MTTPDPELMSPEDYAECSADVLASITTLDWCKIRLRYSYGMNNIHEAPETQLIVVAHALANRTKPEGWERFEQATPTDNLAEVTAMWRALNPPEEEEAREDYKSRDEGALEAESPLQPGDPSTP